VTGTCIVTPEWCVVCRVRQTALNSKLLNHILPVTGQVNCFSAAPQTTSCIFEAPHFYQLSPSACAITLYMTRFVVSIDAALPFGLWATHQTHCRNHNPHYYANVCRWTYCPTSVSSVAQLQSAQDYISSKGS